jgi:voltage-gated potassium channel
MRPQLQRFVEPVIALLALLSVALICLEYLVALPTGWMNVVYLADVTICLIFAVEFIWRYRSTGQKKRFLRESWYEVLAMLPAYAFVLLQAQPFLGAVVRSLRLLRVARLILLLVRLRRGVRAATWLLERSYLGYLSFVSFTLVLGGANGAYLLERDLPGAQITSLGDAFWWSLATVTTVGYGDIVPNTAIGRLLGVVLMFVGIAFISVFVSGLGSAMTERRVKGNADEAENLKDSILQVIRRRLSHPDSLSTEEVRVLETLSQALQGVDRSGT